MEEMRGGLWLFLRSGVLALTGLCLWATGQEADIIRIQGKEYFLFSNPLEDHISRLPEAERPYFRPLGTNNWRGYVATWEVAEGRLYMVGIMAQRLARPVTQDEVKTEYERRQKAAGWPPYDPGKTYNLIRLVLQGDETRWVPYELKDLFPGRVQDARVFAAWFSGELRIPEGKLLRYVHMGYGSIYEQERFLQVKGGVVLSERVEDNRGKELPDEMELGARELKKLKKEAVEKPASALNQKLVPEPPRVP